MGGDQCLECVFRDVLISFGILLSLLALLISLNHLYQKVKKDDDESDNKNRNEKLPLNKKIGKQLRRLCVLFIVVAYYGVTVVCLMVLFDGIGGTDAIVAGVFTVSCVPFLCLFCFVLFSFLLTK